MVYIRNAIFQQRSEIPLVDPFKILPGDSFDDGVMLYRTPDLLELGRIANYARERINGDRVYYNVNRHINYTNVCVIDCQLCQGAYARKPGEDGGYAMQLDQVFRFAEQEYTEGIALADAIGELFV